jgi:hypothetical protein
MLANGVTGPNHLVTGHLMSLEPTLIPMATLLSRSDGTPSGRDVISPRLLQLSVSKSSVLDRVAMVRLAPSTLPSTELEV